LDELQKKLLLRHLPARIACFDISNMGGNQAVGSAVRFSHGTPDKQWYRRYRIKTVHQADDYGMMAEVLERHYRQPLIGDNLPDLIMIDGGKGQLNIARDILDKLGISTPDLISLAKGRPERLRTRRSKAEEKVYLCRRKNPVILPRRAPALFLLQQIRDEAHRFAISYHKKIREKEVLYSSLEDIPGIGSRRKQQLLKHFGSLNGIAEASMEALQAVPKLSKGLAQDIFSFFHGIERLG
jgi:excinuclease ABC subunit C